ncbi:MAG: alpha/beta hydrolase [Bacteroidota bacterium]
MKKLILRTVGKFINITAILFPKWNGAYCFNLLCKVKRVGISEKGRQFFDEGETVFLDADGHSAVLHQWGVGKKKILLLHGWLSNSQRWNTYVAQLDLNEYQVFALDAPGHGMAKGNHLNLEIYRKALMQSMERIGPIDTLVCHSFGSLVGGYAYLYNANIPVKSFVIMGSPSGIDAIFTYSKTALGLSAKAIANLELKINSVLKLPHYTISMSQFFQKVERPVLVIHEVSDRITPIEPIRMASEKRKEIRTFFTQGQDHNLKGEETLNRVIQFIKE